MITNRSLQLLITLLCFAALCLAQQEPAVQQPKPGASPAWSVGNQAAPVEIEVFNDYQCPPCVTFNMKLKNVLEKYPGKVRIVFRNFPLTRTHLNALAAAQSAEAAGFQGKFIEMIDLLFAKQSEWAQSNNAKKLFRLYARSLELDLNKFSLDVNSYDVQQRIQLDLERAKSLGVPGTPTVLVDGKMIEHEDRENLNQLIDAALSNSNK